MSDFEVKEMVMNAKIIKKQILPLIIGLVGFSATVEGVLPPFIENNQSKEELVTLDNVLEFAGKLYGEHQKNFREEYKRTQQYRESNEAAYIQALESLGLPEDRQKIETHLRILLEHSDSKDVKFVAMKTLLIAGILKEESLQAIERVVTHNMTNKDLIYLIFMERHMIMGERPINFPLAGKKKYFDFMGKDLVSGELDSIGNGYDFFIISKEILGGISAEQTEKMVVDMARVYSAVPREWQIKLAGDFTLMATDKKVKTKYDHLIVDEILKVATRVKLDESYRVKIMVLSSMITLALEDGYSEDSIRSIKSMILQAEDEELVGLLVLALFKVNDDVVQAKAYDMVKKSRNLNAKVSACKYFSERKAPQVVSTYIEILKSLDANKMMSESEDGALYWRKSSETVMVRHINEFRGITTLDEDFEAVRKDILEWWDENSSDEKFYFKGALNGAE